MIQLRKQLRAVVSLFVLVKTAAAISVGRSFCLNNDARNDRKEEEKPQRLAATLFFRHSKPTTSLQPVVTLLAIITKSIFNLIPARLTALLPLTAAKTHDFQLTDLPICHLEYEMIVYQFNDISFFLFFLCSLHPLLVQVVLHWEFDFSTS